MHDAPCITRCCTLSVDTVDADALDALERENASLRKALQLIHRIANLLRESLEEEPACYAVLAGVTAGVGLGFNRAMLFMRDGRELSGSMAVGPATREEADRVWRSIEAEAIDLETLYEAGLRAREQRKSALDERVRGLHVDIEGESPVALALRRGRLVRRGDDDLEGLLDLATGVAAPLRSADGVAGVLYADNCFTGARVEPAIELAFTLIADHAGRVIDNARRYERLAEEARTDPLTGLLNHGAMMDAIGAHVDAGDALSFIMIDLDDFKQVNDAHGHLSGDALLAAFAERLRGSLRSGGTPYRYGGEEFAVVLPQVSLDDAIGIAERIRSAIRDELFVVGSTTRRITCSIGVAAWSSGETAMGVVAAADGALYRAKHGGKDRVERGC